MGRAHAARRKARRRRGEGECVGDETCKGTLANVGRKRCATYFLLDITKEDGAALPQDAGDGARRSCGNGHVVSRDGGSGGVEVGAFGHKNEGVKGVRLGPR